MNARGGDIEPSGCASTLPGGSTLNFAIIAQPVAQTLTARDAMLQAETGDLRHPGRDALHPERPCTLEVRRATTPPCMSLVPTVGLPGCRRPK